MKSIDERNNKMICFVGGGGKTTLIRFLAKNYTQKNKSVVITTTTAMQRLPDVDYEVVGQHPIRTEKGKITFLYKNMIHNSKVKGFEGEEAEKRISSCQADIILCEADGAKCKPIKAPRDDEPLLLKNATHIVGVIGMSAYEKDLTESICHRMDYMQKITKENTVSQQMLYDVITHPNGLFKKAEMCKKILVFNQCDSKYLQHIAFDIFLQVQNSVDVCYITSFQNNFFKKLTK